jgi:hypothetical protein
MCRGLKWKKVVAAAWLVLPPVWFFFELHWVRRTRPEELASLKESQHSAAKIWAGVAAALGLLFFGK